MPRPGRNDSPRVTLEGSVSRVVYEQEDSGFAVLVLQQAEDGGEAVAVGNLLGIKPGESVRLSGAWVDHARYGRRFEAQSYATVAPRTVAGLEQYLGSGMIPGIGPGFARRIVGHFGLETLAVLDHAGARLREVPGIGAARAKQVARAWHEQREQRGIMLFLQSYGISAAHARRIYRQFGARARAVLQDDPYRLASHVPGMGFRTADRIAAQLGIAPDSQQRIQAAALHQLAEAAAEGDVFLPEPALRQRTADLAGLTDQRKAVQAIAALCREGRMVCADLPAAGQPAATVPARYLPHLAAAETRAAGRLADLLATPARGPAAAIAVAGDTGIELSPAQQAAAARLLRSKVGVLTGGPGTGKTTLVRWIAGSFRRIGARIALAAPTGRAAKRLEESAGMAASTIHRLLEFSPREGTFTRNREHPLATDLVVVDETSMVDIVLLAALLDAVPDRSRLLFVGDADQLPSVGAGAVLADLALVAAIPTVRLAEVFRQSAASRIVRAAHAINRGEFDPAAVTAGGGHGADFYFIARREPEQVGDTLEQVVTSRIPRRFSLDPRHDIQVLSPMNRGPLGTVQLNARLRERLNPAPPPAPGSGSSAGAGEGGRLRIGDRVLQTRNNYQLEVFNGDIGQVIDVDNDAGAVRVAFAGREVEYGGSDRDDLVLAYAISIHRSQGSEFPAVVIPVHTQHFVMLRRNLLYTAVTRGKRLVVVVGSEMAVSIAVRRGADRERHSALAERVAGAGRAP